MGKRPITVTGAPASSTDPSTWSTLASVRRSKAGDGIGVMLGDGLACYDLDHCLDADGQVVSEEARRILDTVNSIHTEVSMSGDGLHLFVRAPESRGVNTPGVEFYSRARFIAVTGRAWAPTT
jgi:primase-polymerase (primpol)-like protein